MAASFSVTMRCLNCGHGSGSVTITNVNQAAWGDWNRAGGKVKDRANRCPHCGHIFKVAFSSIALTHSENVGANATVTHTITEPGSIASAVS